MKLLELPEFLKNRRAVWAASHFTWFVTAHEFTSLAADAGASVAVGDAASGVVVLTTGGTDNNEALIRTTNELFKFAADRPALVEARVQYSEANADDANVCVGFADAMGANLLVDDGAGPKTTFSGALIYKLDGETVWSFRTSVGTTKTTTVTQHTAGGSAYQVLRVEARESGGVVELVPFLNGQQMLDANNRPIKHTVDPASATEMHAGVYAKAGGANSEVVNVDLLAAGQLAY